MMNPRWSFSSIALVLWVGVAFILPTARAVGLIHLSWWICAAPFGVLFLFVGVTVIFAGLLGHAVFQEEQQQRDVVSDFQNDGASSPTTAPTTSRFVTKK